MCFVIIFWCVALANLSVHLSICALLLEPFEVFLLVRSGRYWYLALPSLAKGPVKHKSATLLKNIIEFSSQGAFKMVGRSKWLVFRRVAPSRSITLLIYSRGGQCKSENGMHSKCASPLLWSQLRARKAVLYLGHTQYGLVSCGHKGAIALLRASNNLLKSERSIFDHREKSAIFRQGRPSRVRDLWGSDRHHALAQLISEFQDRRSDPCKQVENMFTFWINILKEWEFSCCHVKSCERFYFRWYSLEVDG